MDKIAKGMSLMAVVAGVIAVFCGCNHATTAASSAAPDSAAQAAKDGQARAAAMEQQFKQNNPGK